MFCIRRGCLALAAFSLLPCIFGAPVRAQINDGRRAHASGPHSSAFLDQIAANFDRWDLNHDGELSHAEIDRATGDATMYGPSAAALVALKRAISSKTSTVGALTRESIAACVAASQAERKAQPNFDKLYATALARIARIDHDLFATGTPKLEMVHQGRMGDCFALAPLGAMIHRDPQAVVKMFEISQDGSVRVTFGDGVPVTIAPVTDAEIALSASAREDGVWVNDYEKAVGEQRVESRAGSKSGPSADTAKSSDDNAPSALDAIARGGSEGRVMTLITGHRVKRVSCAPWHEAPPAVDPKSAAVKPADATPPADGKLTTAGHTPDTTSPGQSDVRRDARLVSLRAQLVSAITEKRLVCAASPASGLKVPGLSFKHAYAILEYDAERDTVLVWNPHGNNFRPRGDPGLENGYPTSAGQFTLPLKEAITFFSSITFETDQPAKPAR